MPGEADTGGVAYGEVKRMYVDPAQRGQRLGVRLLGALEDGLRADGCRLALLETVSAKLRVFRAPEFMATAFMFAVLGLLVHLLLGA
jgi:GNAT superfamily N-acetyltransferase